MTNQKRIKRLHSKPRCIISNEILEGKEAVCKKNINVYVEKQGQEIIDKKV